MLYNLSSILDARNAKARLDLLIKRGVVVELTEKKPKRSTSQNNYLHLCLAYFASETGYSLEWVKKNYYKCNCNRDLFVREKYDELLGRPVRFLRSSADLTTEEMSLSIDRFRNWALLEAGVDIPDAEQQEAVSQMQVEVWRNRRYIEGINN